MTRVRQNDAAREARRSDRLRENVEANQSPQVAMGVVTLRLYVSYGSRATYCSQVEMYDARGYRRWERNGWIHRLLRRRYMSGVKQHSPNSVSRRATLY